jgi:predicted ATPase
MIQSLELENFKSIKKKYFHLRHLNVLLGLNGMGKSSFIQHLLALRQSKNISDGRFDLNGEYINIGTTKDALYQYAKDSSLASHIKFSDNNDINLIFDYKIDADSFLNKKSNIISNEKINSIRLKESLFNNNFQYLKANRQAPKTVNDKNYSQVVELENIGNMGEYAAHYIEVFGNDDIILDSLIHADSFMKDEITNETIINRTLINQINLWLGEISPNVNIKTRSISSDHIILEYTFKQPNLGNSNLYKPENVGFGITYALPVILALLKSKVGDLIIIESPESHIHPRGQAVLGKLIALTAQSGVQIIIETHSDHIVNGIRVATKDKIIDKDNALIYYFEKNIAEDEQYSKITNIELDKNGELSEYPRDMMDEWANQLMKLL